MYEKHISRIDDVLLFAGSRGDKSWTYIILGRPGPTGKTTLYNALTHNGYNAIEISEDIVCLVDYRDDENHFLVDYAHKKAIVVLNKIWPGATNRKDY